MPSYSQEKKFWSLEECIEYSLSNNLQIKQQQISFLLSQSAVNANKASLLPNLNANATHVYNYGRTIDLFTNEFASQRVRSNNFYLSSSVTLFNGFQLLNNVRKSMADMKADKFNLEKVKNDIALSISTAYLQILYSNEMLKIAQEQRSITEQQLNRAAKLVEAGTLARGDFLAIDAQLASDELSVVNALNSRDMALLTLAQMLDLKTTDDFDIIIPEISVPENNSSLLLSVEGIYNQALKSLPEIKSAELGVESAAVGISIAKGMYSPRITLSGSLGTGFSGASRSVKDYSFDGGLDTIAFTYEVVSVPVVTPSYTVIYEVTSFNKQINDNLNKSIGLYMSIPLFNGFQARSNVAKSKLAFQGAQNNLEIAKNQVMKDVRQAKADAAAALNRYVAANRGLGAIKESYEYAQQKFDVGLIGIHEYNDARNKVIQIESELLQAKYEFVFRMQVLDFYMGKPLWVK